MRTFWRGGAIGCLWAGLILADSPDESLIGCTAAVAFAVLSLGRADS